MIRTAAALMIGNEILSGKVDDLNATFLAKELRALGVELRRIVVVPDEEPEIVAAVRALGPSHDAVITSGGVGPTHDDITFSSIATALDRPLERHPGLAELIRAFYRGAATEESLRMADIPRGAELFEHTSLKVPVVIVDNVYVLPGLPSIFKQKVVALRERFRSEPYHLRLMYLDCEETQIAAILDDVHARHQPALALGSYPEPDGDGHRVKLTLESKDVALVERVLAELSERLPGEYVVRSE